MDAQIEAQVEQFFADFQVANIEGYRNFFDDDLLMITPGVAGMRGLENYLEYEQDLDRQRKRLDCTVGWEGRSVDRIGDVYRASGRLTLKFTHAGNERIVQHVTTFFLKEAEAGWRCFHCQGTSID